MGTASRKDWQIYASVGAFVNINAKLGLHLQYNPRAWLRRPINASFVPRNCRLRRLRSYRRRFVNGLVSPQALSRPMECQRWLTVKDSTSRFLKSKRKTHFWHSYIDGPSKGYDDAHLYRVSISQLTLHQHYRQNQKKCGPHLGSDDVPLVASR